MGYVLDNNSYVVLPFKIEVGFLSIKYASLIAHLPQNSKGSLAWKFVDIFCWLYHFLGGVNATYLMHYPMLNIKISRGT